MAREDDSGQQGRDAGSEVGHPISSQGGRVVPDHVQQLGGHIHRSLPQASKTRGQLCRWACQISQESRCTSCPVSAVRGDGGKLPGAITGGWGISGELEQ